MTVQENLLTAVRAADGGSLGPQLRAALAGCGDPAIMRQAGRVLAGRGADPQARPLSVAILATCTIGPFEPLLVASLAAGGMSTTVVARREYGTFELALASPEWTTAAPDLVVCLMDESYFLPDDWAAGDAGALVGLIEARTDDLCALVRTAVAASTSTLVLHTVPLPATVRDNLISVRARAAVAGAWHCSQAGLLALAAEHHRVSVVDLAGVLADVPAGARDDRLHRYAELPYTDAALLALAHEVRRVAQAQLGLSRKVLAVDLDNTLWGGVLGEVGRHGVQLGGLYPGNCYRQLQLVVRRLREQGVILVLLSKNDPDAVDEALADHPEVVLRPEAFSVRSVNWSAKAENLRAAADSLSLSPSSFVFLDDSAFERGAVTSELPDVVAVAADGDPAHIVRSLLRSGWFDVLELTATDRARPELYRTRALRTEFSAGFSSSAEYLRALDIRLVAEPVTSFTVARVAQLAARTNQFNLSGVRFDEATTAQLVSDPGHLVAAFSVSDRFGDEGIVGAAWIDRSTPVWRVSNLVLSCRVLGRGVELAIAGWIAHQAIGAGAAAIEGRFVPSGKNAVARDFWIRAGYQPDGAPDSGVFRLDLTAAGASGGPSAADRPTTVPDWIAIAERSPAR
jgi:FkbH-like protein